jgi:hypothetical protein
MPVDRLMLVNGLLSLGRADVARRGLGGQPRAVDRLPEIPSVPDRRMFPGGPADDDRRVPSPGRDPSGARFGRITVRVRLS